MNFITPITKPIGNLFQSTGELILHTAKVAVSPVVTYHPDEFIWDTLHIVSPFPGHTERCVNYVKRCIRQSVLFDEKKQGTVTFTIDPKDSYAFSFKKVDPAIVVDNVNEWLSRIKGKPNTEEWPVSIYFILPSDPKSKLNYGDKFAVNYF